MTGGTNIRAIGPEEAQVAESEVTSEEEVLPQLDDDLADEEWEETYSGRRRNRWVWPTLAISAIVAWTCFYGWAHQQDILSGGSLQQWTGWTTAWAVPVLLVTSAWLLIMRNSSREAERFGVIAQTLSTEAAELESRLVTVNRELSLAREFLGSQSRELDSLGRIATERLSDHASNLQSLVHSNGEQIDAIASVSATALENMGKLRDDLPVIANSAKDVSNQIGTAGMTAHTQVAELISGFERLNQFGKASESQVDSIQAKIDVALTTFEARTNELEELTEQRFGALAEKSEAFRADLDGREVEALAAMRRRAEALEDEFARTREELEQDEAEALKSLRARLTALHHESEVISNSVSEREDTALALWDERIETLRSQLTSAIEEIQKVDEQALISANRKLEALRTEAETVDANIAERDSRLAAQIEARRMSLTENEADAIAGLEARFAQLDKAVSSRQEAQLEAADVLAERSEAIAGRIGSLTAVLAQVSAEAEKTQSDTEQSASQIASTLATTQASIEGTGAVVQELTEACVRLLELIQASAQHSQTDLPDALGIAEARLTEVKDQTEGLDSLIAGTVEKADTLSSYVFKTQLAERETSEEIDGLQRRIEQAHSVTQERLNLLKSDLSTLNEDSDLLSEKAQDQLRAAIIALEDAAKAVPTSIEQNLAISVERLASSVAIETGSALDRSLENATRESIARLEDKVAETNALGRETTIQLRDQLAKIDELAGNLESRVIRAREQAEEQVNNDFARRMALLTESLNSNAIDIAKAMSTDVTDTAWASYLKGDRGIFTRRAVRLLDNTEARDIAEIYDDDADFRENVSRYIHDFESMLRSMLSTRDGNALGVTILSSDMGKLYVALAQSIERLRD